MGHTDQLQRASKPITQVNPGNSSELKWLNISEHFTVQQQDYDFVFNTKQEGTCLKKSKELASLYPCV